MLNKTLGCLTALTMSLSLSMSAIAAPAASSDTTFSPAQQKAIEKIVHNYLVSQPQVLMEASQSLQEKQAKEAQKQALIGLNKNKDQIFKDTKSPMAGNANGNVYLVEFFDYQCSHCKEMQPTIAALVKKNPNLKVVFKEFPIFGAISDAAAKAALAANKQDKYMSFHDALFATTKPLTEASIMEIAKTAGLNTDQLKKDMDSPEVKKELADNFALAKALSLEGTPSFALANRGLTQFEFIPGAATEPELQKIIVKFSGGK